MSKFNDPLGARRSGGPLALVALTCAMSMMPCTGAGAAVDTAADKPAARSPKADASVLSARKFERRPASIRCWQEGRLVYEGSILAPTTRGATAVEIRSVDAAESSVHVLDLKTGLCFVESPAQPPMPSEVAR